MVPILKGDGELIAIIDVDCKVLGGFDEFDRVWCMSFPFLYPGSESTRKICANWKQ